MPALPWIQRHEIDSDRTYIAMASVFLSRTTDQCRRSCGTRYEYDDNSQTPAGLVGYTLNAQPVRKTFCTFSVWDDQATTSTRSPPQTRTGRSFGGSRPAWVRPVSESGLAATRSR
jgi:hypothetical protein